VPLATIGLLTTALFVTHFVVQLPAGRAIDRFGARRVGLASLAAIVLGSLIALAAPSLAVALLGRVVTGLGSGAGFIAGLDLIRAAGGGATMQGLYGGASIAGGGIALAVVPQLYGPLGWRAPYWTALGLALAVAAVLAAIPVAARGPTHAGVRAGILRERRLYPLGALHAACFGLSVIAGNWIVTLLERQGHSARDAGLAGSLVLFAGIVSRPAGGWLVRRAPERTRALVGASLLTAAAGALLLAAAPPLPVSALAAAVLGLATGIPFAPVFSAAQRVRPDAPAAAVALSNGVAVLAIIVGTPLAGLAFGLPGDGRIAFVAIGAAAAAALLALRQARTL
jgi:MFS family permease